MLCRHSIHRSSRLRTHFSDLIYGSFIMTDYRNIATKDGILRNTKNQHYTASIGYSNALDLLFANVKASYWRANNNLTYAYSYDGSLTYIESVNVPNLSHGLMLEAKVSKQILSIGTISILEAAGIATWCFWGPNSPIKRRNSTILWMPEIC